jgi:uncharacterized protein (UPF0332 family)
MEKKNYTLVWTGRREKKETGTLEHWNKYFGFNCKTIKALVRKAQNNYSEREAACYTRTFIELEKQNEN